MDGDRELKRLSELIHLCASTLRLLSQTNRRDGHLEMKLAVELDRIAEDTHRLACRTQRWLQS